ncbi:MAG: DUF1552 domain-containing protein [Polyangia bacterium]
MNKQWLASRRALLGILGAGGAAAMFPFRKAVAAPPTRFIVVHVPEGMWTSAKRPEAGATTLGPIFGPLDPYRSQITVLNNLNMQSRDHGPGGDGHKRGVPHMLTCIEMADTNNAGGPSIDQRIAQSIGAGLKFDSLQFGVRIIYGDTNSKCIWSAPSRVVPSMQSPFDAYKRIFGDAVMPAPAPGGGTATPPFDMKKSAMDFALADLTSLRTRLPVSDRDRLDSYQDSLRDIEKRLSTVAPPVTTGGACAAPTLSAAIDVKNVANYPTIGKLQMDLMVAALQCGLTRVASLQWGNSNDQCTYPWLGINALGHDLAHNNGNVDSSGSKKQMVFNWYAQQFAYLLGKLQGTAEGTGTMLDNTVILWVSEFSDGNAHRADKLLWLLMGNANGYFKQGRVLDMGGRSVSDLHVSLLNAFGIQDKTFGNPAYCKGPLTALQG